VNKSKLIVELAAYESETNGRNEEAVHFYELAKVINSPF
jgi:hypothetical protein